MKRIRNIIASALLLVSMSTAVPTNVLAKSNDTIRDTKKEVIIDDPQYDQMYTYAWITTKKKIRRTYGEWREGPSGGGSKAGANVGFEYQKGFNMSYTNSISGSFPAGKSQIEFALECSIGVSESYGSSYSIAVPVGEKLTIYYREKFDVYKVVQQKWQYPISMIGEPKKVGGEYVSYVEKFVEWDYDGKRSIIDK